MNDSQDPLDQWLAYRQEQTADLDICQAVRNELAGSFTPSANQIQDSQILRYPLLRITTSALIRLGILLGWFVSST